MTTKSKPYIKPLSATLVMVAVLSGWLYRELRPTIIFHTPQESKYLRKVSEIDECIEKLYVENHVARYRLPHVWNWKEENEVANFYPSLQRPVSKGGFGPLEAGRVFG